MSNINRITKTRGVFATLFLSQACLMAGCEPPTAEDDDLRTWTGYTSEEYPPLICPDQYAVSGADCIGSYCDDIALYCSYTGRSTGGQTWLPYFSEEGSGTADEGHCPSGDMWMTGISCTGSYCDNISLLCSHVYGSTTGSCTWTDSYSEEQAPFVAPPGYFIKGVECDGDYCDNKRYRYCWMY